MLHNHRGVVVAGALGLLLGCSGKYDVGVSPTGGAGSTASSGGASRAGDTSQNGFAGSGVVTSTGGSAATGGEPSAGAGGVPIGQSTYCGVTIPYEPPPQLDATMVVWLRLSAFLTNQMPQMPTAPLPSLVTRQWAGDLAMSMLDSLGETPSPGIVSTMQGWLPGSPNSATWASLFNSPKSTLTDLLTTPSLLNHGVGVLTDPAVLGQTDFTRRGQYVRENLTCTPIPSEPPGVPGLGDPPAGQTHRQQFEAAAASPVCAACHTQFVGLGYALQNYDSVGSYVTADNGSPIDSSGVLPLFSGGTLSFKNATDLGTQLAGTCDVTMCLVQQMLTAAAKNPTLLVRDDQDPVRIARIAQTVAAGATLRDLVRAVAESDDFVGAE